MCRLTEVLERSAIAGPLVGLACRSISNVQTALENATLSKVLSMVLSPFQGILQNPLLQNALTGLIFLNLALLIPGLSALDTGPIGVLTWGLLLLSIVQVVLRRDIAWSKQFTVVDILVLLFVASACVSAGFSSYLKYSVVGLAKMSTFLAGYLSFRVLSITQAEKQGFLKMLALLLALMGTAQAFIGFNQFFNHVDARATWVDPTINAELNMTRIFGTLKPANPNLLAGFLIPCLVAALGVCHWQCADLLTIMGTGVRKFILPKMALLFLALGMTTAILGALVLTGSRGGFLALAGIAAVLFGLWGHLLWNPQQSKPNASQPKSIFSPKVLKGLWVGVLVSIVVAVIGVISVSPQLQHRVASIFAMRKDSSISYRLNVYNSVQEMIRDNPLIGIGPGNDTFKRVYGYYMVPGFNALGAYSVPLEIAAEQGLLGLGIFAVLLLVLAVRTLYFLETDRPLFEKMVAILLFCGILASILYGVFDTIWYRPSVNLLFWLFVALQVQITRPLEADARFARLTSSGHEA